MIWPMRCARSRSTVLTRSDNTVSLDVPVSSPAEPKCDEGAAPLVLHESRDNRLQYTYSVSWIESNVRDRNHYSQATMLSCTQKPWATRWDSYLKLTGTRVHWFSLINSSIICVFLCVVSVPELTNFCC